jgi:hypothetical protein
MGGGTPTNPTEQTSPSDPTSPTNPESPTDPTSPTEPVPPPATDPSTGCSPVFGQFAVGSWPLGCWRPYAADSPINKPLTAAPSLHSNSADIVHRILSMGTIGKVTGNVDPVYDWQVPYYFSSLSDPLFTLSFSENWGATSGCRALRG